MDKEIKDESSQILEEPSIREQLIAFLKMKQGASIKEIADQLGKSKHTISVVFFKNKRTFIKVDKEWRLRETATQIKKTTKAAPNLIKAAHKVEVKAEKKPILDIKGKPNEIRMLLFTGAAMLFVIGGVIAIAGNSAANPLVIFLGVAVMAGGILLFMHTWQRKGARILGQIIPKEKPNSLNIYRRRVAFEYVEVEKVLGQPQRCYNDKQFYHVHTVSEDGSMGEFILPDDEDSQRYYDPREFANVVTMPLNKKYFTWAGTTMQKISIAVLGLVIAGELIGLIAVGGK